MDLALSKAVDRLEAVLTAETGALASGTPIDLGEIAARKNQSLLEFSRLSRRMPARDDVEPEFGDNCPVDPFEVSDADTMMAYLKGEESGGVAKPSVSFVG